MLSRRFPFLTALCVGLIVGIGYPFGDVGLACRVPTSEACVWGKAYFPLTLSVSVLVLAGPVTGLLIWWHGRRSRDDARLTRNPKGTGGQRCGSSAIALARPSIATLGDNMASRL
jgi:hypothetical protein